MKIKVAARHISYRTLFHTILILAFLLPFVFILTALVTLEGVNKCSSFGEFYFLLAFTCFQGFLCSSVWAFFWLFWLWLFLHVVDGSSFDLGCDCFLISWSCYCLYVCIWLWGVWILIWFGVRLFFHMWCIRVLFYSHFVTSLHIFHECGLCLFWTLMVNIFNLLTSFFCITNTLFSPLIYMFKYTHGWYSFDYDFRICDWYQGWWI
jgi:hypothetical protein